MYEDSTGVKAELTKAITLKFNLPEKRLYVQTCATLEVTRFSSKIVEISMMKESISN